MAYVRRRVPMALMAIVFAFATSGCASLLNPYVRAAELDTQDAAAAGLPASDAAGNKALVEGIRIAAAQRKAYYGAVADRAKLRNGLPLALVPLSAAALYKGAVSSGDRTRELLLQEGLLGASLFALGSYYTSTTREQIYLAGAKALTCSIYAASGYYVPDSLGAKLGDEAIARIGTLLAQVDQGRRGAQLFAQGMPAGDPQRPQVDALGDRAGTSIAAARQVLQRAVDFRAGVDSAGPQLRANVEAIVGEVSLQLSRAEPEPGAILTLAGSLPTLGKSFAPGASFTVAGAPAAAPALGVSGSPLATAVAALPGQIRDLDQAVAELQFALDVMAQRLRSVPTAASCQVQAPQGVLDISPEGAVDMKPGETRQFVVRSSLGIPSIEWVGAVSPKVVMSKNVAGDTVLVQVAYTEAVAGLDQVTFQAAVKEIKKTLAINLQPATKSAPAPGPGGGKNDKDGKKPETAKKDSTGNAAAGAPEAPRTPFEKSLTPEKINALQARLGVAPQTGKLDAATRAAIAKWQAEHKKPQKNGALQGFVYDEIMK